MTTIKDIARIAEVSPSTVSFVLNGRAKQMKVSPATEQKILDIVNALNYKPNTNARKLRTNEISRPVIAIYWPLDYRASYIGRILNSLRSELELLHLNCDLVVNTYIENHLYEDKDLLSRNHYDYAIIGAAAQKDMDFLSHLKTPLPIILYNRQLEGYHSVYVDYTNTLKKVLEIAIAKGHKHIAFFKNKSHFIAGSARMHSAIEFGKTAGLAVSDDLIIETEDTYEGGSIAVKKLLNLKPLPSLLFCASDVMAIGASYQLQKEGIAIPGQIELLCFDLADRQLPKYCTPSISTIEIPTEEMIAGAVQILASQLNHADSKPVSRSYEPATQFRDSFNI